MDISRRRRSNGQQECEQTLSVTDQQENAIKAPMKYTSHSHAIMRKWSIQLSISVFKILVFPTTYRWEKKSTHFKLCNFLVPFQ